MELASTENDDADSPAMIMIGLTELGFLFDLMQEGADLELLREELCVPSLDSSDALVARAAIESMSMRGLVRIYGDEVQYEPPVELIASVILEAPPVIKMGVSDGERGSILRVVDGTSLRLILLTLNPGAYLVSFVDKGRKLSDIVLNNLERMASEVDGEHLDVVLACGGQSDGEATLIVSLEDLRELPRQGLPRSYEIEVERFLKAVVG